jgi:hypothetical protein
MFASTGERKVKLLDGKLRCEEEEKEVLRIGFHRHLDVKQETTAPSLVDGTTVFPNRHHVLRSAAGETGNALPAAALPLPTGRLTDVREDEELENHIFAKVCPSYSLSLSSLLLPIITERRNVPKKSMLARKDVPELVLTGFRMLSRSFVPAAPSFALSLHILFLLCSKLLAWQAGISLARFFWISEPCFVFLFWLQSQQIPGNIPSSRLKTAVSSVDQLRVPLAESNTECQAQAQAQAQAQRKPRRRMKGTRSLTELEYDELRGWSDLGFKVSKDDLTPEVVSMLPGLKILGSEDGLQPLRISSPRVRVYSPKHGMWIPRRPESPVLNLHMPAAIGEGGVDMKSQLKFWARAVASTVRIEC